jgi:hypothetical protein
MNERRHTIRVMSNRFEPRADGVIHALPKRMALAFPELSGLFALLAMAHAQGHVWRSAFDGLTESLSDTRLRALSDELDDLFAICDNDRTFELIVTVLGLDLAIADEEYPTLYQLVATIEERLSGERLARSSAAA